jgi:hypothetical protein
MDQDDLPPEPETQPPDNSTFGGALGMVFAGAVSVAIVVVLAVLILWVAKHLL